jgi:superfamily II DNA/RNA helicase
LVPTRELAAQVVAALEPFAALRSRRIVAIYGGVSLERQAQALHRGIDIVVATPGRLNDLLERRAVSLAAVEVVVLDEADQMADMGFLPQVERILRQVGSRHQTLLFSATLDGDVDQIVKRYQDRPAYHDAEPDANQTSDMKHRFVEVSEDDRVSVAADIAAGPGRTLFFVRTQRAADRLARRLKAEGVPAHALHGRMSQPQRERALHSFKSGYVRVLVATNIAARGIHVDCVDIVVHHDLPDDAKTYIHRSGRTARAGASGIVVTFVGRHQIRDANVLRRQAGLHAPIVPMRPGDPRLRDLGADEATPNGAIKTPVGPAPRRREHGHALPPAAGGLGRGRRFIRKGAVPA